jgi:hypothetical protein
VQGALKAGHKVRERPKGNDEAHKGKVDDCVFVELEKDRGEKKR